MTIAYTWTTTVGGTTYKALNSDISGGETFIEIDRGPYPGAAKLTFRADDAAAIMGASAAVPIAITPHERTGGGSWTAGTPISFNGWYPECARVVDDDPEIVQITFRDARKFLAETEINKRYNVIYSNFAQDPATLDDGLPWELGDVLGDIFAQAPSGPSVALVDGGALDNLIFDCTVAEAVEQILAVRGKAYIWNPFTGTASIADSDGVGAGTAAVNSAINAGRLIRQYSPDENKTVEISIIPWEPIRQTHFANHLFPSVTASSPATQEKRIIIRHFQSEVDGFVAAAAKWYSPIDHRSDLELFGIVAQPPTPRVARCRWEFKDSATRSRFSNFVQRELPWPAFPLIFVREDTHFLFTLTESLESGTAAANLTYMDASTGETGEEIVRDPIGMFAELEAGARGICIFQREKYYVIQAECETDEETTPEPPPGAP